MNSCKHAPKCTFSTFVNCYERSNMEMSLECVAILWGVIYVQHSDNHFAHCCFSNIYHLCHNTLVNIIVHKFICAAERQLHYQ